MAVRYDPVSKTFIQTGQGQWTPAGGGQFIGGGPANVPGGSNQVYDPVAGRVRPASDYVPPPYVPEKPETPQPPGPGPGPSGPSLSDLFAAMQAEQARLRAEALAEKKRNAIETTKALLVNLGLEEEFVTGIMPDIQNIVNEGIYDGAVISARLRSTPTYKTRFKANDQRIAKGLSALTPAEYLGLERQYRQILSEGGLPAGFYDSKEDFSQFIGNDISVNELTQRVGLAQSVVQSTDSTIRDQLRQFYDVGTGDLTAFFLDPNRAKTALQRKVNVATVAGALGRAGFQVGEEFAAQLAEGVTGGGQAQISLPESMRAAEQAAALRPLTQQVVGGEAGAVAERDLLSAQITGDVMASQQLAREQQRRLAEYGQGGSLAATQEGVVGLRRARR